MFGSPLASAIVMLSEPLVPLMVSVSFATAAEGDDAVRAAGVELYSGAAPAVPTVPKPTASAATEARLN